MIRIHEVDFIISVREELKLYECKWTENPPADIESFRFLEHNAGKNRILSRSVITPVREDPKKGDMLVENSIDIESIDL